MEALLLGLGTGTSCLLYCGPIIVPYLLAEGGSLNEKVKALIASAQTENGWIARIKLEK
ncbi:MAG: hypothetical protein GH151_14555 [Bacteroidetes bacterium]|nr:hypothetical protein [Bacteroidota bacterium]